MIVLFVKKKNNNQIQNYDKDHNSYDNCYILA